MANIALFVKLTIFIFGPAKNEKFLKQDCFYNQSIILACFSNLN